MGRPEPSVADLDGSWACYMRVVARNGARARTVAQSAVRVCLAMLREDPFQFGAALAAAFAPDDVDALMRAIECAREEEQNDE